MKKYDYLIVGAGISGATCARVLTDSGMRCLVIDRRSHIAGNVYTKYVEGIEVHQYGPHIFHTDNERVWEFVQRFAEFNHFVYSPIANYKGQLYNLPFNMNTFHQLWGVNTPAEAQAIIEKQKKESGIREPQNLEEQAIKLVGLDIYEKLIKGYTEKQWGRPCTALPDFIIKRLPVRFVYDNNYFNHPHQGIPKSGYTAMVEKMLEGIDVRLSVDFLRDRDALLEQTEHVIYTGPVDEYYDYELGTLEYRSLRFETEVLNVPNYQGVAGVNYTDSETPYTRIVEHKHFRFMEGNPEKTVITKEYPAEWHKGEESYYPVNDARNEVLYKKYAEKASKDDKVIFAGRLGTYKYYDMDKALAAALELTDKLLQANK